MVIFSHILPNNRKRVRYEEPQGALDMASTAMRSKGIAAAMVSIAIASIVRYIVPWGYVIEFVCDYWVLTGFYSTPLL